MRVWNNFKPLPRVWDQPGRTNAMQHATCKIVIASVGLKIFKHS